MHDTYLSLLSTFTLSMIHDVALYVWNHTKHIEILWKIRVLVFIPNMHGFFYIFIYRIGSQNVQASVRWWCLIDIQLGNHRPVLFFLLLTMLLSPHKIYADTFLNDMHVKVYLVVQWSVDLILSKKCWNRAWNKAETTSPACTSGSG